MKYVELTIVVAVEDDFEWESELGEKLMALQDIEGICEYTPEFGCSVDHSGSGRVYTEEQWNAKFEDE